jgi:transposase
VTKQQLIQENSVQKRQIDQLNTTVAQQNLELENKDLIIAKLSKMLFGATSEKRSKPDPPAEEQLQLFDTPDAEEAPLKELITYERKKTQKTKKTPTRQPLPPDLPRVEVTLEPEQDTTELVKIGEEVTEVLDIIPPQFRVIRLIRPKYAHPQADRQDIDQPIVIAPMPWRVIDKGIPSTRLLAYIIVGKFIQHLPYYRQIQIFQRIGVNIKSNTLNGWIEKTCVLLKPLYDAFCQHQFSKSYLQADETSIKVLKVAKKGKKSKAHKGYFWVYYDPLEHHVVFVFKPGRGRKYPAQDLQNFAGTLQTDGLSVYDAFDQLDHITLISCMAHIRRKFIDALKNDPQRANHVLDLIEQLYHIETTARDNHHTPQQRHQLRQQKAKPLMTELENYLQTQYESRQVLPKSAIGQAIQYALGRWKYQVRYLEDGRLEIDNNGVENAIRPVAVGRKNYLFAGSERGAQWAAIFYTLLGSALRHGHNPLEYLTDILQRLPETNLSQLHQFFPNNWTPNQVKSDLNLI